MDYLERIKAHKTEIPDYYLPTPETHLTSIRDATHYYYAKDKLKEFSEASVLDIGCWDGWLDFLLINDGYKVHGVELDSSLAKAAERYAAKNNIEYKIFNGFFDQQKFAEKYDVVMCFETLEHIEPIKPFIELMEKVCKKRILISLPDQRKEDNIQHLWTPTEALILNLFSHKKNFVINYQVYHNFPLPPNWFISYDI